MKKSFYYYVWRSISAAVEIIVVVWHTLFTRLRLLFVGAVCEGPLTVSGPLHLHIPPGARVHFGRHVRINSGFMRNAVGGSLRTGIWLGRNGELSIGSSVGISNATIVCTNRVEIGDRTLIGGGVRIYDTDFHPLDIDDRRAMRPGLSKAIHIGCDVFIGGHSTILKGVKIENGAVIGACSVVTKNVGPNELWAGNPAKFIKHIVTENVK